MNIPDTGIKIKAIQIENHPYYELDEVCSIARQMQEIFKASGHGEVPITISYNGDILVLSRKGNLYHPFNKKD